MKKSHEVREHEVALCGDVKSWADALFASQPDWSFTHAKIEQFGSGTNSHQATYASPEQAALVAELAEVGMRGRVDVPNSSSDCDKCLKQLQARLASAQERFAEVAALRTGTQSLQEKTAALLMQWYILGRGP